MCVFPNMMNQECYSERTSNDQEKELMASVALEKLPLCNFAPKTKRPLKHNFAKLVENGPCNIPWVNLLYCEQKKV